MKLLSNNDLVHTYKKAVEMELDPEFILLLLEEMKRRGIDPPASDKLKESSEPYKFVNTASR